MLAAANSDQLTAAPTPKIYLQIDVSCMGQELSDNTASINSYGDNPIRIQMAWQVDHISRHYLSKEIPAGSVTPQQAEMLVLAHCADDAVGRAYNYSDKIEDALSAARQVKITPQPAAPASLAPAATP